jgi:chromosome segregation ATPase
MLIEYTKQVQLKDQEISRLTQTINELSKSVESLKEELNKNHSAIEDLEFQLEEHKLGLNENVDVEEESKLPTPNAKTDQLAEELNRLKDLVQTQSLEIEQMKANERTLLDERDEIFRNLEVFEEKIKMSQVETDENAKLKQVLKENEVNIKYLTDDNEKLRFLCDENDIKKFEFDSKLKEYEEDKVISDSKINKLETKNIQVQALYDELKQQTQLNEKEIEVKLKNEYNQKISGLELLVEQHQIELKSLDELKEKIRLANEHAEHLTKKIADYEKANDDLVSQIL